MSMVEERLQHFLQLRLTKKDTINAYMKMSLVSYDFEHTSVTLAFPVEAWQLNPAGQMHGGLISAALDITMGCVCYIFSEASFTPTIQMSVNFNKGIKEGSILLIEGICDHVGSRMGQARAIATIQNEQGVVASANGSYAINQLRKEKTEK